MKPYDLNLLRALRALQDTDSVTAAAERIHLSVPAMSHTLARLREAMGDPLFVRAGRRLVPTPRALELREPVARLLDEAQALAAPAAARQALSDVVRTFVVRAPEGTAVGFGAALALALQARMPRATLHLMPEAVGDMSALRDGRIDLDIGSFRRRDPEVRVHELSRQGLLVALHADAVPAGRLTLRRYAALRHIGVTPRPRESSPVDDALEAQGLRRQVVLIVPNSPAALLAAARSPFAATVPERLARAMAPALGLHLLPLPLAVEREPMLMAWHPRLDADPAHRCLRECVLQVITDPSRSPPPDRHFTAPPI